MSEALALNAELKTSETVSRVSLDKEKKKAVSLSLRMSLLRKIDRLSFISEITRSEAVEMAIAHSIDELLRLAKIEKEKKRSRS